MASLRSRITSLSDGGVSRQAYVRDLAGYSHFAAKKNFEKNAPSRDTVGKKHRSSTSSISDGERSIPSESYSPRRRNVYGAFCIDDVVEMSRKLLPQLWLGYIV